MDGQAKDLGFIPQEATQAIDLGIVRNPQGRIISTQWPHRPHSQWKKAYKEIGQGITKQVQFELELKKKGRRDLFGAYKAEGVTFNLNNRTLDQPLKEQITAKMQELSRDWWWDNPAVRDDKGRPEKVLRVPQNAQAIPVEVCDIGGGAGTLMGFATLDYKNKYGGQKALGRFLHTTLTTLVHHDKEAIVENWGDSIDEVRTMAIEIPPDDFYRKFDVLSAQNSVFFWSDYPELATLNMWKMLKDNGVVVATIPPVAREISGVSFDIKSYLTSSPLFRYEELGQNQDGSISVLLRRNKIDENSLLPST